MGGGSYISVLEADLQYQKFRNRTNELKNIHELLSWFK